MPAEGITTAAGGESGTDREASAARADDGVALGFGAHENPMAADEQARLPSLPVTPKQWSLHSCGMPRLLCRETATYLRQ